MSKIMDAVQKEQAKQDIPVFRAGDNISVSVKIVEGSKERIQVFSGTVILMKGSGLGKTFTVRKISGNVWVERIFPIHSPNIAKIVVEKTGRVRRAKLYYLRDRQGKSARIKERREKVS